MWFNLLWEMALVRRTAQFDGWNMRGFFFGQLKSASTSFSTDFVWVMKDYCVDFGIQYMWKLLKYSRILGYLWGFGKWKCNHLYLTDFFRLKIAFHLSTGARVGHEQQMLLNFSCRIFSKKNQDIALSTEWLKRANSSELFIEKIIHIKIDFTTWTLFSISTG